MKKTREMAISQLDSWLLGENKHNGDPGDPQSICCPDFSCCEPSLEVDMETKKEFVRAFYAEDGEKIMSMLMTFHNALIALKKDQGEL